MSFLSEINDYWRSSGNLNNALSYLKVYTGRVPESMSYPYAVIVPVGSSPTWLTGGPYLENFTFQISVFDTDPDNVESIARLVMAEFDFKAISAACVQCMRTNTLFFADSETPARVYHVLIQYEYLCNRSL